MESSLNKKEIELLYKDPRSLIIAYQPVIKIIIQRYMQTGFIKVHDKDDYLQHVNEELLKRVEKIQKNFNGKAQLRTYISVIIRNICLELIKKNQMSHEDITESKNIEEGSEETLSGIIIEQEFYRFQKILMLFSKQKARLELCLKILYRIPVSQKDLEAYYPGLKEKDYQKALKNIDPQKTYTDKEVYELITPFLNECEKKDNTADAVRKWTKLKIDELIELMNGNPKRANYNKETIQILLEKYYSQKKN